METSPQEAELAASAEANAPMASPWSIFRRRLASQRLALVGGAILVILYLAALFAGFLAPCGYERQDRDRFSSAYAAAAVGMAIGGARI